MQPGRLFQRAHVLGMNEFKLQIVRVFGGEVQFVMNKARYGRTNDSPPGLRHDFSDLPGAASMKMAPVS